MAVSDTLIDTLFDGRYRIVRRLGAGGMANVYLAEDQELGRRVAIKILNERHSADEQFIERFRREAKNAASLSHPNIVSIYDRGEAEGTYYIAMEHLDGRNLKELIVARGPAPPHIAIEYTRQILAALRFAHRNGIVHRDIKPHNVLVDADGRLKVTDFGIARAGAASQMTEAGSIVGTAQYLSPEQARGGAVDQRSDLYSIGIVLYELLTGTVPFTGDSPVEIAMKHLSAPAPPPSSKRAELPRDLDLIVMRAIAKDPDDRYQDADEMDADLERVARGAGVTSETAEASTAILAGPATAQTAITRPRDSRPPGPVYAPAPVYYDYDERPQRRRPIWPWLLAVLLLAGAVVGGFLVYDQIQTELSANEPVAVPLVEGSRESIAVNLLSERGIDVDVVRRPNLAQPVGFVYDQDPEAGKRIDRETDPVTIYVSLGKPKALVPNLVGRTRDDAIAELTERRLEWRVREVFSEKPVNTVTGQDPKPGARIDQGSTVRINVSKGVRPIEVPSVEGQPIESATATLQAAGFSVARNDVDSEQPEGTVVAQDPPGGSQAARGSTVTLNVSKGPTTRAVPDVESLDRETAAETLRNSGFRVAVIHQDTEDPSLENFVLAQDPPGGTQAEPGSTVTITVGRFVPPEEEEPPPAEPPPAANPACHSVSPGRVRVAVLMGGRSSEREVSLASARSVIEALDRSRYDIVTVAIEGDGHWELGTGENGKVSVAETLPVPVGGSVPATLAGVDVVLPILHGPFGEDGTVQGLLELAGVPYIGAGVTASALCMDKDLFKAVLRDRGIPVTQNVTLREGDAVRNPFGYPVFVKPARLGSSIGITKVHGPDELDAAVALARRHDDKVLVEEFVRGIEVECSVLGAREPVASLPGQIVLTHAEWYDYSAKYDEGEMELVVPPPLPQETIERVQQVSVEAFVATDCEGMARADCFVRDDGEVLVNELNTIPGFTSTSVYAKLFEASGLPYVELLDRLIELALERHERRSRLLY